MARRNNAEALGESLSAEETQLLDDNRTAEIEIPAGDPPPEEHEQPAPKEEAKTEDDDEPHFDPADIDPATGKAKKVNYGAFHAERARRKAADAARIEAEKNVATLMGRFGVLEQLAKQAAPVATAKADGPIEVPDINVDPVGHFRALYENQAKEVADIKQWRETQEGERTAMNNVQELTRVAQSHEAEFVKKTPDYPDAFAYIRQMRDRELETMGYKDPAQRAQQIHTDALQIAAQALNSGMNAAEVVYNIAKARGYVAKAPVAAKPGDTQKLETVAKGQQANTSLGQVNGTAKAPTSVEALLKLSDEEFAAATTGKKWRELMGGN